jgi:hypothetical protein
MRNFKIFFAIQIAVFLLNILTAKSQPPECPYGFDQSKTVTITVGGCDYSVKVCFKCEAGTNPATLVTVYSITKLGSCNPGMNENEVIQEIYNIVFQANWLATNTCEGIGPCDHPSPGGLWYTLCFYMCWGKVTDAQFPFTVRMMPCWWGESGVYCSELWRICWNENEQKYIRTKFGDSEISGIFFCQGEVEIPGDPEPGQQSLCWEVPSPCNPEK